MNTFGCGDGSQSVDGRAWFRCCRSGAMRLGRRNFGHAGRARDGAGRATPPLRATDSPAVAAPGRADCVYPDSLVAQVLAASTFPSKS